MEGVRPEIEELGILGPLPSTKSILENPAAEADYRRYVDLISTIQEPVTNDEARALIRVFGPDDAFEIVWRIIHLIETAPDGPLQDCLTDPQNEWVLLLKQRIEKCTTAETYPNALTE